MQTDWRAFGVGALLLLSGCTTALVSNPTGSGPVSGLVYRLPKKQFDVTTTYELLKCSSVNGQVQLDTKVTTTVSEALVGDETQTYVLDYAQLAALTKTSKLDVNLSDSGVLTSVNSAMTDQTGPIIANVAKTAFTVAEAVAFPQIAVARELPLSASGSPNSLFTLRLLKNIHVLNDAERNKEKVTQNLCDTFNEARKSYDDALIGVRKANDDAKKLKAAQDAFDELDALQKVRKDEQEFYKQYGTAAQYNAATAELNTAAKATAAAQRKVKAYTGTSVDEASKKAADAKTKVAIEQVYSFTPTAAQPSGIATLQFSKINGLFEPAVKPCVKSDQLDCVNLPKVLVEVKPIAGGIAKAGAFEGNAGVVYRLPVTSRLNVYTTDNTEHPVDTLVDQLTQVPQYGQLASLNLRNGPFADNLLKITFNSNGTPNQMSFSSQSQADSAAKAASDTAQSYLSFAKSRQQDKVDAAKTQISLDKDRADANASIVADNLKTLHDLQQLHALASGQASAADTKLNALNSQRDMLEVQLKILQLQKQINDAASGLAALSQ
ncbi:hypothetical protein [Burkholderia sp. NLJ2]|uniref:hypothetical protein n=1 Tax=Burkholderia sp. NLJ2 TaxID=3090699 RepID=UPI003C6CA6EC